MKRSCGLYFCAVCNIKRLEISLLIIVIVNNGEQLFDLATVTLRYADIMEIKSV